MGLPPGQVLLEPLLLTSFLYTPGAPPAPLHHSRRPGPWSAAPNTHGSPRARTQCHPSLDLSPAQVQPQQHQDISGTGWMNSLIPTSYQRDNSISPSLYFLIICPNQKYVKYQKKKNLRQKGKKLINSLLTVIYFLPAFSLFRIGDDFVACVLCSRSHCKDFFGVNSYV